MSDKHYWYGYLEAGEKSSPVLRDNQLETGSSDTLYLFNFRRGEILEYKRSIIEPKLRELDSSEQALGKEIKAAYSAARARFTPRSSTVTALPYKGRKNRIAANDAPDDEEMRDYADTASMDDMPWLEEEA